MWVLDLNQTQVLRLGGKYLYPLGYVMGLILTSLNKKLSYIFSVLWIAELSD